jgi:hypothetical protein
MSRRPGKYTGDIGERFDRSLDNRNMQKIDCVHLITVNIPGGGIMQYCQLEREDPCFNIFDDCPVEYCIMRD